MLYPMKATTHSDNTTKFEKQLLWFDLELVSEINFEPNSCTFFSHTWKMTC